MKQELKKIFDKYLFNSKNIDFSLSISTIIDDVENELSEKKQFVSDDILFHSELLHLKRIYDLKKLNENKDFIEIKNQIISELGFKENFEFLIYEKPLDIISVRYNSNIYGLTVKCLDKNQQKIIRQLNFKIDKVKIPKFYNIKCVYCEGKHANLNPDTKEFCLSDYFFNCDLNCDNISNILQSMKCMDLKSHYLNSDDITNILPILTEDQFKCH